MAIAIVLLTCANAEAQSFRTKATGKGAAAPGQGLVSVRVTVDDPSGRVESAELLVQASCAFASDTERMIELSRTAVVDLEHDRSCKVVRSFLCVTMSEEVSKSSEMNFDSGKKAKLQPAGIVVVIDGTVAMRVAAWSGVPRLGAREDGMISGNLVDGFLIKGSKWSAETTPREVCLGDGISRYLKMHDPALDGH